MKVRQQKMVDIKGLDKARVLKALYEHSHIKCVGYTHERFPGDRDSEVLSVYVRPVTEKQTYFDYLYRRVLKVDLSRDEFDERPYDRICGEGAAQRAVDSIRAEKQDNGDTSKDADTTKDADGEKKELTMEEKVELTIEAMKKILNILTELPPDVSFAAFTYLKMTLPGLEDMGIPPMLGGLFTPPMGGPFPFKGRFG